MSSVFLVRKYDFNNNANDNLGDVEVRIVGYCDSKEYAEFLIRNCFKDLIYKSWTGDVYPRYEIEEINEIGIQDSYTSM